MCVHVVLAASHQFLLFLCLFTRFNFIHVPILHDKLFSTLWDLFSSLLSLIRFVDAECTIIIWQFALGFIMWSLARFSGCVSYIFRGNCCWCTDGFTCIITFNALWWNRNMFALADRWSILFVITSNKVSRNFGQIDLMKLLWLLLFSSVFYPPGVVFKV